MQGLPATLTKDQRRAVWIAQYRLANSRLPEPKPDSVCVELAMVRVEDEHQRDSDQAAWAALRETLVPRIDPTNSEELARLFHDTYERLAPAFGYETRPDTKAFDPNSPNGQLMQVVCAEVAFAILTHRAGS